MFLALIITVGVCVRIAATNYRDMLLRGSSLFRHVLVQPPFRYEEMKEALSLAYDFGTDPYIVSDSFKQSPGVLLGFRLLQATGNLGFYYDVLNCILELCTAVFVFLISKKFSGDADKRVAHFVTALYYVNPISILAFVLRSLDISYTFMVLGSLALVLYGQSFLSALFLSLAASLCPYAVFLSLPLSLFIDGGKRIHKTYLIHFTGLSMAIWYVNAMLAEYVNAEVNSWMAATFLGYFTHEDLRPNVGVHWYLFMEVFSEYRSLYLCYLLVVPASIVPPLVYLLKSRPLHLFVALQAIIATFGFYSSIFDWICIFPLLACLRETLGSSEEVPFYLITIIGSVVIQFVEWRLWVQTRMGNANFFFFNNVSYIFGGVWLISNVVKRTIREIREEKQKID